MTEQLIDIFLEYDYHDGLSDEELGEIIQKIERLYEQNIQSK